MAGEPLSRREQQAVKRFERRREERLRWRYYRSIPQKHWRAMSGRHPKVLKEQAARYGLPFGDKTVDLTKLAPALHDLLNRCGPLLVAETSGTDTPSAALERYRAERAALARLDRLEREGALLPRDQVRTVLLRIAALLREAGETLRRDFGEAAADIVREALEEAGREIERTFGPGGDGTDAASDG